MIASAESCCARWGGGEGAAAAGALAAVLSEPAAAIFIETIGALLLDKRRMIFPVVETFMGTFAAVPVESSPA